MMWFTGIGDFTMAFLILFSEIPPCLDNNQIQKPLLTGEVNHVNLSAALATKEQDSCSKKPIHKAYSLAAPWHAGYSPRTCTFLPVHDLKKHQLYLYLLCMWLGRTLRSLL